MYALITHQLQVERRESHRANQVYALTTHQLQVERRERHRANQVDGHLTRASGGNLARTPPLFMRSAVGFIMTTESQDLGLMSHPKDGAF